MTAPLCFTDCETTSLTLDRLPWEVAFIIRDTDGLMSTYHAFIDVGLDRADQDSLAIGGYYDRHPRGLFVTGHAPIEPVHSDTFLLPEDAAGVIAAMTDGRHMVSSTAFDPVTYELLLHEFGIRPTWDHHVIDVQALALGWLHGNSHGARFEAELRGNDYPVMSLPNTGPMPPWKSDELSRACGVEPPGDDERHTALGDTRWVMRWYDAITDGGAA